jgi:S1-C subfamily serine protease
MKISPRRALSTILAAALLLGTVPQEASAQVVRLTAGQTGSMPVSPVGASAAGTTMAPALVLGAASLNGSFSASWIAPSPVAVMTAAAQAPVAPIALSVAVRAAASEDAPKLPNAPKAAAPVEKKTWGERLASMLGRKPAPAKTPTNASSSEAAKTNADNIFDGTSEKEAAPEGVPVSAGDIKITHTGLKASLINRLSLSQEKRKLHVDEFGGPLTEPMNLKQRVGYGLKQGLNLVGIGALLNVTLRPILDLFPWPQYLTDATLRGFGRVALLTKYGPNEIVAGLADSPATFLGISLPMAVTMEEITYRLLGFGLTFLALAAVKPFTRWLSSMIDGLPDASGVVGGAKRVLKIGEWLTHFAFPIAAALSSVNFAVAHFAMWGFSPFVFALNLILGLFLARTAYKSRGLTSPIIAHLIFNFVTIGGMLVAMSFSPLTGAAFAIVAGLIGVASLLYSYLSARKERAFQLKNGGKALAALMIVVLSLSAFNGATYSPVNEAASRASVSTVIQQIKDQKTETAAQPATPVVAAPADSAAIESRADMVARVKPSVVNVIVHVPNGYMIGSGFILTPEGVFITNGHVVGDKKPGDIINARVPGVDGELKAKVLAVNHDKDLAIVQLQARPDGKPWPTVKLAQTAPREGEEVTAIGYPRGLPFTVSKGVVSGLDGRGSMYVRKLQTDAAINPGNSGGPLFNDKGEVIGVNTEIRTESGGSEGLGFSIQAPEVARVMAQYARTGNIATASLGIIANLSDPQAPDAGLEIEYVRHGSAAEKAGLKRGDLIIGVGGDMIEQGGEEAAGHVASVLSKMIPGQTTTIIVLRGDSPVELKLTVDAKTTTAPSH